MRITASRPGSLLLILLVLPVAACSTTREISSADLEPVFNDAAFPGADEVSIESSDDVFALGTEARAYLDTNIASIRDFHDRGKALLDELFHQAELNLSYRSNANSTADETFHNRSANCLSLSILAYAMAEHVGLDARFQEVDIPAFWERRDNYSLMNRHVNILLRPKETIDTMLVLRRVEFEVDFQPLPGFRHPPTRTITRQRALAMFYNNKAVDALLAKDHDHAYAYLKAALKQDPTLDMALSNLALLYRNEGHDEFARRSYEQALASSPGNGIAAEGLAAILRENGEEDEAAAMLYRVKQARRDNPWFQYIRGEEAYDDHEWLKAIGFYREALALKDNVDTFHFGLARAYLQLGKRDLAEMHLRKAKRFAGYDDLKQKYQSKLIALSSL